MSTLEAELGSTERYAQFVEQPAVTFELLDADGETLSLADLRGKVVVLDFIYARCRDTCPLHSALIAQVQSMVADVPHLSEQVRFVTVATDTEDAGETRVAMRRHGEIHGLRPDNWTFLYGGPGRERAGIELAAAYGLSFVETDGEAQMHGVVTHVIDPAGRLRARFHGLEFAPLNLMLYVAALAHGEHDESASPETRDVPPHAAPVLFGATVALTAILAGGFVWLRRRRSTAPASRRSR